MRSAWPKQGWAGMANPWSRSRNRIPHCARLPGPHAESGPRIRNSGGHNGGCSGNL